MISEEEYKVIKTYQSINYTREWFDNHQYVYRAGQGFDPYIGEYFLVDLYAGEIWLVKGSKPKYDKRRGKKLPIEPICQVFNSKDIGYVNGYWQMSKNEMYTEYARRFE